MFLRQKTERGLYDLVLKPEGGRIPMGQIHAWTLEIRDGEGAPVQPDGISVDGGMPQHAHGLPTTPRVTRRLDDGVFLIEGLKFHMEGEWVLNLGISGPTGRDIARIPVHVAP